jgi:UDP-N-acetyl-D-mannosaminuronic acid dehydrogenase
MSESTFPKVCVVGLGYIGLPTASLLASKGFSVHGVDVSPRVVDIIRAGKIHIQEPELDILVKAAVQSGRLTVGLEPCEADLFIIAVPTPFTDGHRPDLSYVQAATESLASQLRGHELVILESTSPVGTTEKVSDWIAARRPDLKIGKGAAVASRESRVKVAHCPERVLPGRILRELVENDRIVGGIDDLSTEAAASFYERFVSGEVLRTNSRTAEMAKLSENTFRDVNIALANELSLICDQLDIDVWELIGLANRHPRVNILLPGPGVGGHCIAVDPWFIVDSAPQLSKLIRTAREVNHLKPQKVVERVLQRAARIHEPTIACFGLAYKPDVDDLRESPAIEITRELATAQPGRVVAVEPYIDHIPEELAQLQVPLLDVDQALEQSDIIVALVPHKQFRRISHSKLQEKIIIDTCGLMR